MLEVIILALALSMDAFAVSIGLGAKRLQRSSIVMLKVALYFGVFQGVMPLLGYWGGQSVLGWIEAYASWIAFGLLLLVGAKMLHESFSDDLDESIQGVTHKMFLMLAIATSIDAMAAGFTLILLDVSPWLACLLIGLVTAIVSPIGVLVGEKAGVHLENKAEFIGGLVLILIGFKILLF